MAIVESSSVSRRHIGWSVFAVAGLTLFYLATAPEYHSTAVDSYNLAHVIADRPFFSGGLRLFLWLTSMQALFAIASLFVADPDPFFVVGIANAFQTALAVLLLQRLLWRHFDIPAPAATLTAGLFAVSYGTWRYATELEVYASAALMALLLLTAAFSADFERRDGRWKSLLGLAALGAIATLYYQPLGIVAGFAVPVYLILQFSAKLSLAYYAASGTFLAIGLAIVRALKFSGAPFDIQQILDSDGKGPSLPDLAEFGQAIVASLQNFLSINWIFAFGPTREIVESVYAKQFIQELVAAQEPHGEILFLLTLPTAAAILVASIVLLRTRAQKLSISPQETATLVWLGMHAAMSLSLHPQGFETWLPALVPMTLLVGSRISGPLVQLGYGILVASMVMVFLIHNWFAGVAVFAWAKDDYNRERGDISLSLATRGDLLVVGDNWALERYLNYTGEAETVLATRESLSNISEKVSSVLSKGGRVFLYDDFISPAPETFQTSSSFRDAHSALEPHFGGGKRLDLGLGYAVEIFAHSD